MKTQSYFFLFLCYLTGLAQPAMAQPHLEKDYSFVMEIPSVISMESSSAHLYVLSNTEGMVVFRAHPDTLQWLYSSTGMEQRGNTVTADIRFAYLFGYNRRLTILEPTSVLGVYSSTLLPEQPLDVKRINQNLYLALGNKGLGQLSLRTPASVDSAITPVAPNQLADASVIDLEASYNQLFALSSNQKLFIFSKTNNTITADRQVPLLRTLDHIFLLGKTLYGSDSSGNIYELDNEGNLSKLGSISESVQDMITWHGWIFIRGTSNRIWTSYENRAPVLWKNDGKAGNYLTVTQGQLWLCEYNQISRIGTSGQSGPQIATQPESGGNSLKLKPIENQVVPFPKPLLLSLDLASYFPPDQIQYAYQSDIESAKIKGKGFLWQPKTTDVGQHHFKIIVTSSGGQTDSTSFDVEVRSFNTPPRFTPLRPISIPVGQAFTLPIKALDPDGPDRNLVRYLGLDLPEGASIDEQTGKFTWTPTTRQTGKNQFRVIATDQYGAAASTDVSIRVIEATPDMEGQQSQN